MPEFVLHAAALRGIFRQQKTPTTGWRNQLGQTALDRQAREEDEGPSIGIILCKEKGRTVVVYALHEARKPIDVATYRIAKRLPKELKGQLPSPAEIARLLEDVK